MLAGMGVACDRGARTPTYPGGMARSHLTQPRSPRRPWRTSTSSAPPRSAPTRRQRLRRRHLPTGATDGTGSSGCRTAHRAESEQIRRPWPSARSVSASDPALPFGGIAAFAGQTPVGNTSRRRLRVRLRLQGAARDRWMPHARGAPPGVRSPRSARCPPASSPTSGLPSPPATEAAFEAPMSPMDRASATGLLPAALIGRSGTRCRGCAAVAVPAGRRERRHHRRLVPQRERRNHRRDRLARAEGRRPGQGPAMGAGLARRGADRGRSSPATSRSGAPETVACASARCSTRSSRLRSGSCTAPSSAAPRSSMTPSRCSPRWWMTRATTCCTPLGTQTMPHDGGRRGRGAARAHRAALAASPGPRPRPGRDGHPRTAEPAEPARSRNRPVRARITAMTLAAISGTAPEITSAGRAPKSLREPTHEQVRRRPDRRR